MKIRNLNEGIERKVNADRELPRRRRHARKEGLLDLPKIPNIPNPLGEDRPMRRRPRRDVRRVEECGTRKGFPTKRVEREALERRDVPNMAHRRPIGKTRRER